MTNPVVLCATITLYANVTDPTVLSFAPDGTLYTGRDNSGSGGGNADAVKIHRIAPGGTPVTEFGNPAVRDPDAVVFDDAGIAGSVIVGGVDGGVSGRLSRIAPDGSVTTLFGPASVIENPARFLFTAPAAQTLKPKPPSKWQRGCRSRFCGLRSAGTDGKPTWTALSNVRRRLELKPGLGLTNWEAIPRDVTTLSNTASKLDPFVPTNRFYGVQILP